MFSIIQAAGWPIWPLVACSILALALVIERFIEPRSRKVAPPRLLDEASGGVAQRLARRPTWCASSSENSALGEVLASGFRALNSNPRCSEADLRATMEDAGRAVAHRLERYLTALATIASAAPLLGLLGTVDRHDRDLRLADAERRTGGNPAQLAHGISVALYNTAFGLIVAIPALIFWRYFRGRVDAYLLTGALRTGCRRASLRHLNSAARQRAHELSRPAAR